MCNDRVVLAANKTDVTVWGNAKFTTWHPQYNGFMGIVSFTSITDASLLPWTTTKRNIETENPVYRRALSKMKAATTSYTTYTARRKNNIEQAKVFENKLFSDRSVYYPFEKP